MIWRRILREVGIMLIMAIAFAALFILGSLAIYQKLPRWW